MYVYEDYHILGFDTVLPFQRNQLPAAARLHSITYQMTIVFIVINIKITVHC